MAANLKAGNIDGYCVGEPWNARAVIDNMGFVIATDQDLWPGHPEKVLGLTEDWVNRYPNSTVALVKALLEACEYCDHTHHREEIVDLLAQYQYVGADAKYIRPGFLDDYTFSTDAPPQSLPKFNQFFLGQTNYPNADEGLWMLTQLARWDLAPFPKNRIALLDRVYRVDVFTRAAQELGHPVLEPNRAPFALFDGVYFDPNDPLTYLKKFSISRTPRLETIPMEVAPAVEATPT
jgi:nitrate/nitrite transport system ATP-binding protein